MKRKLYPARGKMVVVPNDEDVVTAGGIVLPETALGRPQFGEVVTSNCAYDVGDVVVFGKYSGTEIELDGDTLIVLDERDVLAKVVEVV